MSVGNTTDILFEEIDNAGVITLNRPKSLNALNSTILLRLHPQLTQWEKTKKLVIIKGAGKCFCAGGDVKEVSKADSSSTFALTEYNINYMIGNYKIPYIAFLDGFAMGGGLGVSVHGRYRVATENTVVAMPECKIGLIPDVGGTYFLPRLPYNLGIYLALTANQLNGEDAVTAGIATHFVPSSNLIELQVKLTRCATDADIQQVLSRFHVTPSLFSLTPHLKSIEYCFAADSVESIIARLKIVDNDWSAKTIGTISELCPLTLKLTMKALLRGAKLDLWACLVMEYRLVTRLSSNYNFIEGVRALLIEKDKKPHWKPATLTEVNEDDLSVFFEPLPNNRDLKRIYQVQSKI